VQYNQVVVSGGGSNSEVVMHIFADVFGIPAFRSKMNNAAGLGSAICAAVGEGLYGSWDQAIENMVSWEPPLLPTRPTTVCTAHGCRLRRGSEPDGQDLREVLRDLRLTGFEIGVLGRLQSPQLVNGDVAAKHVTWLDLDEARFGGLAQAVREAPRAAGVEHAARR